MSTVVCFGQFLSNEESLNFCVDRYYRRRLDSEHNSGIAACKILVLILALLCHLSRQRCDFVLFVLRIIISKLSQREDTDRFVSEMIPRDVRTLIYQFDIDPCLQSYIVCPVCFCLQPDTRPYPERCSFQSTPNSPRCNSTLLSKSANGDKSMSKPIRKYLHQDLKQWLARTLARPDIVAALQNSTPTPWTSEQKFDIWHGDEVRKLKGPDGQPFIIPQPGELRLIFSLGFDGFDPFHMKPGKGGRTSTAIYMVLLNLPPDLRYHPENTYLAGVIPGPGKPSKEEINHFSRLIVDDLLEFWFPGVIYSRTASNTSEVLVLGALIPIVCDLPAARQISGFGSHSARSLCSVCLIEKDDIENFNKSSWNYRLYEEHLSFAKLWRDAESRSQREALFKEHGVRWSEFLRLPYWNPMRFTVVDTMHAHNLGNLKFHIHRVWGLGSGNKTGDGNLDHACTPPTCDQVSDPQKWNANLRILDRGTLQELAELSFPVLWHLCYERNLRRVGSPNKLARTLLDWVGRSFEEYRCQNLHRVSAIPQGTLSCTDWLNTLSTPPHSCELRPEGSGVSSTTLRRLVLKQSLQVVMILRVRRGTCSPSPCCRLLINVIFES